MPFIDVKASCGITAEQELRLKEGLGEAITRIPGKSEDRLMLCAQNIYLRMSQGTDWAF